MGFVKTLVLLLIVVAVVGLVAFDPTRIAIGDFIVYTLAPAVASGVNSIIGSAWWATYQLAIVTPLVFCLGIFLTAMYYKGKIKMWQWGAKKAIETSYGIKQPAPAPTPTPLAETAPIVVESKKEAT